MVNLITYAGRAVSIVLSRRGGKTGSLSEQPCRVSQFIKASFTFLVWSLSETCQRLFKPA